MVSSAEGALPFNLEHYLSKLTLQPIIHGPSAPPKPPPNARSATTPLTLKPGGYRKLQVIETIKSLDHEAAEYFSTLDGGDRISGLKLNLQAQIPPPEDAGDFNPFVVNNAMNVVNVLSRFLLRDTETLLSTLDEGMGEWKFRTVHCPGTKVGESQVLDPIILCRSDMSGNFNSVKLILLPVGPWEFTSRDFHEFTMLERFDDTPNDPNVVLRQWVNADRMRAHLYDLCLKFDCPYFAVTSYMQWSFGAFSKHFTTAFLSPPIYFNHQPASIAEIFAYWIHVAFGKPDTFTIPVVEEEQDLKIEQLHQERQLHVKRFIPDDVEEAPPAKRGRHDSGEDNFIPPRKPIKQELAVMIRRRNPSRPWLKRLRAAVATKQHGTKLERNRSSQSVISTDHSVAPSCAERLPERLIPRRKNEAILRWRNHVARIEEHGEAPQDVSVVEQGKWVEWLLYDPITGEQTGDVEWVEDHTCSSCAPSSSNLSECSLTSEELAWWNRPTDQDPFEGLLIHQWF